MISWKTRTKSYKTTSVVSLATWPRAKWVAVRKHAKHKNKPAFFRTDVARWPGYLIPWTSIGRDRLLFCGRGVPCVTYGPRFYRGFELFSLHYDEIPGQRISLLTAHSSGRSMSYMPNVSMSRSHQTAGLGNSWLRFSLSANGVSIYPGAILRLPFSHTSYLPPDWFEWPPSGTHHISVFKNATRSSSPQSPCSYQDRLLNRGRLNLNHFYSRGNFNCSWHHCMPACTVATWLFLALEFPGFITSSSKSVCNLLIRSNAVFHSCLSSTLSILLALFFLLLFIPHSFHFGVLFSWWLCEHVSLVFFLPFFCCLSMHSTLGVSGTGTRLDLIEWLLLEHWNVSSSWALHGDGHRHNRTAWEVESILGVFWSSPFIFFSFLTCLLDIREALCTSAYRFFFFFSLLSSAVSTGLTRVSTWGDKRCRFSSLLSLWLYFCFLLLALDIPRSVHVSGPPFSLYCPHTPFLSSPRGW